MPALPGRAFLWSPQGSPSPLTHLCCPLSIVILPPVLSPGLILSQLLVNCGGAEEGDGGEGERPAARKGPVLPCLLRRRMGRPGLPHRPGHASVGLCPSLPTTVAPTLGAARPQQPTQAPTATSRSVLLGCHPTAWLLMPHTFPGAAVTNHHKSRGFKRHRFIPLQFWRSEPKMILWTKIGVLTGLIPPGVGYWLPKRYVCILIPRTYK